MKHIAGLDTLRFICAFVVVLGHFAVPMPQNWGIVEDIWANGFNGPAAVIVFFIISGLCIHYPQTLPAAKALDIPKFYIRRGVRIGLPTAVIVALYLWAGVGLYYPNFAVLWSVICEAVYYLIYPIALLPLRRWFGWGPMITVALVFVAIATIRNLDLLLARDNNYFAFGYFTWIVGLPAWMGGCWLAENISRFPIPSTAGIWLVRFGILALSIVLRAIKFHAPDPWGSNVIWLTVFAGVFIVWVGLEISYRNEHAGSTTLERLGRWSFSVYLVHPAVAELLQGHGTQWNVLIGITGVGLSLVASYVFYLVIELPSHRLAQRLGRRQPSVVVQ